MSKIGLLNEKPLHASLKNWYNKPGDQLELSVDGYVIDLVRGDLLIEIQTGNFASMKQKLNKLLRSHRVRLIYPIAQEKWILKKPDDTKDKIIRRKSPKRGRLEDLFWEMVSIPQLLSHINFSLEVVLIKEDEVRRYRGKQKWRRKEWGTEERRLLDVVEQKLFEQPADWQVFLPDDLETFTARDLAETKDLRLQLAQKIVYCLRHAGLIRLTGKRGRAYLYRINEAQSFHKTSVQKSLLTK